MTNQPEWLEAIRERNRTHNIANDIGVQSHACCAHLDRASLLKYVDVLTGALAFYADPDTYEQVDLLGQCGLSDDIDDEQETFGRQAKQALTWQPGASEKGGKGE